MRPNILHIFVDQQRFDTIGALGNAIIKTPHLDRLARQGVAFTSAYTACPVCIDGALFHDLRAVCPLHTGCYENAPMPEDGRPSFMDALVGRRGLQRARHWQMPLPPRSARAAGLSFPRGTGGSGRGRRGGFALLPDALREEGYDYVLEPNGSRSEMYYVPQISQLPERLRPSAWIADRAIAHLRAQKESGRPWYLFASFIHPHPPFSPPNPWHKLYRAAQMPPAAAAAGGRRALNLCQPHPKPLQIPRRRAGFPFAAHDEGVLLCLHFLCRLPGGPHSGRLGANRPGGKHPRSVHGGPRPQRLGRLPAALASAPFTIPPPACRCWRGKRAGLKAGAFLRMRR